MVQQTMKKTNFPYSAVQHKIVLWKYTNAKPCKLLVFDIFTSAIQSRWRNSTHTRTLNCRHQIPFAALRRDINATQQHRLAASCLVVRGRE